MIFGCLNSVAIHTKVSLACKYFFEMVRNSQTLAGELRLSSKYLQDVFKLNENNLSILSFDLNSKMAEMLKRWPKVAIIKFTGMSLYEYRYQLRGSRRSLPNLERDIFDQFKKLKDFQMVWNTKTLKEVSLSKFPPHFVNFREGLLNHRISVYRIRYDIKPNYDSVEEQGKSKSP